MGMFGIVYYKALKTLVLDFWKDKATRFTVHLQTVCLMYCMCVWKCDNRQARNVQSLSIGDEKTATKKLERPVNVFTTDKKLFSVNLTTNKGKSGIIN